MRSICLCILLAAPAFGQQFELVSIRANNSMSGHSSSRTDQGMMTGTNISLRNLILRAYGIKDYQLEGPDWLGSEHFDISAKIPEAVSAQRGGREQYKAAFESMMQSMLAERFKLAVHRDRKAMGVYALVVGKNGVKFKKSRPAAHPVPARITRISSVPASRWTPSPPSSRKTRKSPCSISPVSKAYTI